MKKNILTVIIMASSVINLILTIIIVFSVVPAMNKTNNLIDKVCSVIDLEIEANSGEEVSISDLEPILCTNKNGKLTINLKPDEGDEKPKFAILESVTVSINTKAEDYEEVKANVESKSSYVLDIAKEVISSYSYKTMNAEEAKAEVLKRVQQLYDTKSICRVSLDGLLFN